MEFLNMNQKSKWSLWVLLIALSAAGADTVSQPVRQADSAAVLEQRRIINRADHGRQEVERKGDDLVRQANLTLAAGEHMKACSLYRIAKLEFKKFNSPYFTRKMEFCDRQIARCYYLQAESAIREADRSYQRGDFETAIKLCKEALKYCPEQSDRLEALINQYERKKSYAMEREHISSTRLIPNKQDQEYQIEVMLEQGRKLVAANELGAAIRKYQEILLIDPYNAAAVKSLEAVYIRIGKIGDARYNMTHRRMLSETEWKFVSPVFPEADSQQGKNNFVQNNVKKKADVAQTAMHGKLNEIVISEFAFDEIPISVVVNHLRELTKMHDPAKLGINFIWLPNNVASLDKKAAKPADGNAPAAGGAPAAGEGGDAPPANPEGDNADGQEQKGPAEKTVSFSLKDRTVMEVLEEFHNQYGVKYKITDNYVVIAPEHVNLGELESRVFNVEIIDFDGDEQLKGRLSAAGIPYTSEETSLVYDSQVGCVYATNTPENLDKTAKFLEEEYNRTDPLIQVMLKVIEISQKDINELAFNWQYAINSKTTLTNPDGSLKTQTVISENSNELLRYYQSEDASGRGATGAVPDSQLSYVWQDPSGTKLVASMFALNWADSGDVLYSPRVTVRNNYEAEVAMVVKRYFPSEWEIVDLSTPTSETGFRLTKATPQPEFDDDPEDLGLNIKFKPQIIAGSRVIQVRVSFPIQTFVSFMVFDGTDPNDPDSDDYVKMPIFNRRSIDTTVQVYDGDTVLVGGVSTDLTKTYNDKIPILGDIPFIGRFFQSRFSQAEKGNLLIFLTCKIVNPDGSTKYPEGKRPNGVVNFGQNI